MREAAGRTGWDSQRAFAQEQPLPSPLTKTEEMGDLETVLLLGISGS